MTCCSAIQRCKPDGTKVIQVTDHIANTVTVYETDGLTVYTGVVNDCFEECVYPWQFGALGDGSSNDGPAIQQAIDTGIPVHLDRMYYTATQINIPESDRAYSITGKCWESGITAIAAMDNVIFKGNGATSPGTCLQGFRINAANRALVGIRAERGNSWNLERLMINNPVNEGMHFSRAGSNGVNFWEATIDRCHIDCNRTKALAGTSADYCLYGDDGFTDSVMTDCIFSYAKEEGMHFQSGGHRIHGGHIYGGTKVGIWYDGRIMASDIHFDLISDCCIFSDANGGIFSNCQFTNNPFADSYTGPNYIYDSSGTFMISINGYAENIAGVLKPDVFANAGRIEIAINNPGSTPFSERREDGSIV